MKQGRYVVFIIPQYLKDKMKSLDLNRGGRADLRGGALFKMEPRQWWEYEMVEYAIVNPRVCMRLEELMGTNLVRITDRGYMKMLKQRLREDHAKEQDIVMALRMDEEIEREKGLVLAGKMKVEDASQELLEHPVFKASQLTKKLIERRQLAIRKEYLPKCKAYYGPRRPKTKLHEEEQKDELEEAHRLAEDEYMREFNEKKKLLQEVGEISEEYMYSQTDYERFKYESPLVRQLKDLLSVDALYDMAETIVGTFEGPEGESFTEDSVDEEEDEEGEENQDD